MPWGLKATFDKSEIVMKKSMSYFLLVTIVFFSCPFMPARGQMTLPLAPVSWQEFKSLPLTGIIIDSKEPEQLKLLVGNNNQLISDGEMQRQVTFFLTCLTLPENHLWVNLSPYEKDRIMPKVLSETRLGEEMLKQDVLLKKRSAALLRPQGEIGRKFWDALYAKAKDQFGRTDLSVETNHKIWIVADTAKILSLPNRAYILQSRLRVQMEEDVLANSHAQGLKPETATAREFQQASLQLYKEMILPVIEKEVNTSQAFAPVRSMFHAFLLANWLKKHLPSGDSVYGRFVNQGETMGLGYAQSNYDDLLDVQNRIDLTYAVYLKMHKQGFVNEIYENKDGDMARKIFSGGAVVSSKGVVEITQPQREDLKLLQKPHQAMIIRVGEKQINVSPQDKMKQMAKQIYDDLSGLNYETLLKALEDLENATNDKVSKSYLKSRITKLRNFWVRYLNYFNLLALGESPSQEVVGNPLIGLTSINMNLDKEVRSEEGNRAFLAKAINLSKTIKQQHMALGINGRVNQLKTMIKNAAMVSSVIFERDERSFYDEIIRVKNNLEKLINLIKPYNKIGDLLEDNNKKPYLQLLSILSNRQLAVNTLLFMMNSYYEAKERRLPNEKIEAIRTEIVEYKNKVNFKSNELFLQVASVKNRIKDLILRSQQRLDRLKNNIEQDEINMINSWIQDLQFLDGILDKFEETLILELNNEIKMLNDKLNQWVNENRPRPDKATIAYENKKSYGGIRFAEKDMSQKQENQAPDLPDYITRFKMGTLSQIQFSFAKEPVIQSGLRWLGLKETVSSGLENL